MAENTDKFLATLAAVGVPEEVVRAVNAGAEFDARFGGRVDLGEALSEMADSVRETARAVVDAIPVVRDMAAYAVGHPLRTLGVGGSTALAGCAAPCEGEYDIQIDAGCLELAEDPDPDNDGITHFHGTSLNPTGGVPGFPLIVDNCPRTPNSTQVDNNEGGGFGNGLGDACDPIVDEDNRLFDANGVEDVIRDGFMSEFGVEVGDDETVLRLVAPHGVDGVYLPASLQSYTEDGHREPEEERVLGFREEVPFFPGVTGVITPRVAEEGDQDAPELEVTLAQGSSRFAEVAACDGVITSPGDARTIAEFVRDNGVPDSCDEPVRLTGDTDESRTTELDIEDGQYVIALTGENTER